MKLLFDSKKYYIETFGCQMNVRDSEHVAGILEGVGFTHTADKSEADCILYNTCCVREHAEKRVFGNIGALREWKEENPSRILGVFGCMMQQRSIAEKLYKRFPYVDVIFGTAQLLQLGSFLSEAAAGNRVFAVSDASARIEENLPSIRGSLTNAFVNINFGCNNFCSYCIVPYVRGPERSRTPESIEAEVRSLVSEGACEVTLLGQNVNSYGQDLSGMDFPALLERISAIDGLKRLRFMTSHPKDLSDRLIHTMTLRPNICHHVHLPLQSGSDRILEAMNRRYTRAQYMSIVDKLHAAMSDVEITTDIIVGFPGETDSDFQETLDMVSSVDFANAFTFKYSPRIGTKAAVMPDQVPETVKKERLHALNSLQERRVLAQNRRYDGYVGEVLVEGADLREKPLAYGKFSNFKMVYFPGDESLTGRFVRVRVTGVRKSSLVGEQWGKAGC